MFFSSPGSRLKLIMKKSQTLAKASLQWWYLSFDDRKKKTCLRSINHFDSSENLSYDSYFKNISKYSLIHSRKWDAEIPFFCAWARQCSNAYIFVSFSTLTMIINLFFILIGCFFWSIEVCRSEKTRHWDYKSRDFFFFVLFYVRVFDSFESSFLFDTCTHTLMFITWPNQTKKR